MASSWPLALSILLVISTSVLIHYILKNSPIDPLPFHAYPVAPYGIYTPNNFLQKVEKLGEGLVTAPEDILVDVEGTLYTGAADGWVKRMWANGSWENWTYIGGRPLGLRFGLHGEILAIEPTMGLLNVTDGKVSVLSTEADGRNYTSANDLVVTSTGVIYFTESSTKFGIKWVLDYVEARPHGRLLKYDPATRKTSVVLEGLAFANGIEVSQDEDYLVVCESWKFRCLKYWLEGEREGTIEIFIDKMPGGPDNIHRNADGTYWIAQVNMRSRILKIMQSSPFLKKLLAMLPWNVVANLNPSRKNAAVVKVGRDGKAMVYYEDSTGKQIRLVTAAFQHGQHLYLGSLEANFVGRLHLQDSSIV